MAKSIANQLSPSQVLGRAATLLRLLEEEGLPYEAWQVPIDDPAKRRLLVQYWLAGMSALSPAESEEISVQLKSLLALCKTRGPVHDAHAVNKLLGLGYSGAVILHSFTSPPDALPGFLTFFDPGWSILHLRTFCADKGEIFLDQDWYDHEAFAEFKEEPRYRQIRMKAVDGSFNENFDDQRLLLSNTEQVPHARAVVMGMVIHFLISGQRLFEKYTVRCADKAPGGRRVGVGDFDSNGFDVGRYWDDNRHGYLGLASSVPPRKS